MQLVQNNAMQNNAIQNNAMQNNANANNAMHNAMQGKNLLQYLNMPMSVQN